jgi:hypothetical protein
MNRTSSWSHQLYQNNETNQYNEQKIISVAHGGIVCKLSWANRTWLNLPECFHTNENTALDDCEKMSIRKKNFFGFFWFFAFFPKTKRSNLHFLDRKEAT